MKKAIVLAVAMASATSANAAWETGVGFSAPAGELALTVWNTATNTSFTQDLGVSTYSAMDGTLAAQSITLDATGLSHVAGDLADIKWNVAGANQNAGASGSPRTDHLGFYMTGNGAPSESHSVASMSGNFNFFTDYNTKLGSEDSGTAADPVFLLSGSQYAGAGNVWGTQLGGMSANFGVINTSGADLDSLLAYSVTFEGPVNTNWVAESVLRGQWSLDMTSGEVAYSSVSAVPVPAAAWLFGSALVGLVGIGRKRNAK